MYRVVLLFDLGRLVLDFTYTCYITRGVFPISPTIMHDALETCKIKTSSAF